MFYDDYYNEPSEIEELIDELKDMLKSQVRDDIQEKINKLEEENKRMKDIVNNYDKRVAELEEAKRNFEWEKQHLRSTIEQEVKKERITKLLDGFSTKYYCINNIGKEKPKCDKCDERGYIHFLSPSGKELTELCSCREKEDYFEVGQMDCRSFGISNDKTYLVGFYRPHDDDNCFTYYIGNEEKYQGQPFEEIDKYYKVYFKTEEEAQSYADWLNKNKKGK